MVKAKAGSGDEKVKKCVSELIGKVWLDLRFLEEVICLLEKQSSSEEKIGMNSYFWASDPLYIGNFCLYSLLISKNQQQL